MSGAQTFVHVTLPTFHRTLWKAHAAGSMPTKVRDALLRVSLDSEGGTGTKVRLTKRAAADLGIDPRSLSRRLAPFRQLTADCPVAAPWLYRTQAPRRPGPDGEGYQALYRLQAPADLVAVAAKDTETQDNDQRSAKDTSTRGNVQRSSTAKDTRTPEKVQRSPTAKDVLGSNEGHSHAGECPPTSQYLRQSAGTDEEQAARWLAEQTGSDNHAACLAVVRHYAKKQKGNRPPLQWLRACWQRDEQEVRQELQTQHRATSPVPTLNHCGDSNPHAAHRWQDQRNHYHCQG